jgi:hypothetical protein
MNKFVREYVNYAQVRGQLTPPYNECRTYRRRHGPKAAHAQVDMQVCGGCGIWGVPERNYLQGGIIHLQCKEKLNQKSQNS